jgi:hypothetical protein
MAEGDAVRPITKSILPARRENTTGQGLRSRKTKPPSRFAPRRGQSQKDIDQKATKPNDRRSPYGRAIADLQA